jgi:hypothetical protein
VDTGLAMDAGSSRGLSSAERPSDIANHDAGDVDDKMEVKVLARQPAPEGSACRPGGHAAWRVSAGLQAKKTMRVYTMSAELNPEIEKQTRGLFHQTDVMNDKLNTSFFVIVFLLVPDEVAGTLKDYELSILTFQYDVDVDITVTLNQLVLIRSGDDPRAEYPQAAAV